MNHVPCSGASLSLLGRLVNNEKLMETKKAWEILLFAHPNIQALALPLRKDRQRSQPTPVIYHIGHR